MTDDEERPRTWLALVLWLTAIFGGVAVLLLVAAHMSAAGGCGGG